MHLRYYCAVILAGLAAAPSQAARINLAKVPAAASRIPAGLPASAAKLPVPSLALPAVSLIRTPRALPAPAPARPETASLRPVAVPPAAPKVLLLEALGAIGNTGHEDLVKKSLLSIMSDRKPEVLIQDLNLIFDQSPEAVTRFLKENDIGVINISAAMGTSARQQSRWRDLPAASPEDDPELKRGLEMRDQAIKQWSAILSDPKLDINLVIAAPNTPSRDGSYIKPFDVADRTPQYDHLAPFHPSEGTPFPSLDLNAEIPGSGQRYSDKVAIVGGIRTKWSGYGPAVRMFTSPYWHGDRGNSFAAPKIAGLLWRLRTELSLSAAEASRMLFEQLAKPYAYARAGQSYLAKKIPLSRWGWVNRILSDHLLRRATTRDRTTA